MAAHFVESLLLFGDEKSIHFAITNFMDLPAEGMAYLLFKEIINLDGRFHCSLILIYILKPFPTHQRSNCHNSTGKRSTGVSLSCHTSSQCATCFKDLSASYIELFLQSCKNGLRSSRVIHIVLESQFEDLFKKFSSVCHKFPFPKRLCTIYTLFFFLTQIINPYNMPKTKRVVRRFIEILYRIWYELSH